jgi:hypothetical protein
MTNSRFKVSVASALCRAVILFVAAFCLSLVLVGQSRADTTTLSFSQCNTVGLCGAGTVALSLTADAIPEIQAIVTTTGTFSFTELGFNGTGLSGVDDISNSLYTYTAGSKNLDGFGSFAFVIEGPASSAGVQTLTFDITCAAATGCASVTSVLDFASHIISTTGLTGFDATGGAPPPSPEPASMILFGSGLLAIGAKLRRRKSEKEVIA